MKCEKCDYQIPEGSTACNLCGWEPKKESKIKDVTKDVEVNKKVIDDKFFVVSTQKLILLSVFTLGFYELYWFYKNWQVVQKHQEKKLQLFWRAFFSIFYAYSLFKKIFQSAKDKGYTGKGLAGLWAIIYFLILLISNVSYDLFASIEEVGGKISDIWWIGFWILSFLTFIPLLAVQKAIKHNNQHSKGEGVTIGKGETIIIVIGVIIFILSFLIG
jgi:hypothetical protein